MLSEIAADAESPSTPTDKAIETIARLAETQKRLERQLAQAETDVADIKEHLKEVSEGLLPTAMLEAGVAAFTLASGEKITVKPFYGANVSQERKGPCFAWLETNGHGSLIKKTVSVLVERGNAEGYSSLINALTEMGEDYRVSEGIHPQSLQAFVREQVEAGADFPKELFGVFIGRKAKIEESK